MAQSREGLKRLAEAIDQWRDERGLERWEDVAALHGPSMATLRVIRSGTAGEITRLTRMRIARITGWSREYVDALLNDEALPPLVPEDVYEETILRSVMPEDMKRTHIDWYRREGRELLAKKGIRARRLDQARYGD